MVDAHRIQTKISAIVAALPRPPEVERARARLASANRRIDAARAKALATKPELNSETNAAWLDVRLAEAEANAATGEYRDAIRSWTPAVHRALEEAHLEVAEVIVAAVRGLQEAMQLRTHLAIESGKLGIEALVLPQHLVDRQVAAEAQRIIEAKSGAGTRGLASAPAPSSFSVGDGAGNTIGGEP